MIKVRAADLHNFVRAESDSDIIEVTAYTIGATFDGGVTLTVYDDGKYRGAFVSGKQLDVAKDGTLIVR